VHNHKASKERDDLACSLVTSSRPPGQPQKRPNDQTLNASVTVRTADGSRRTADAGDKQCLRCGCSSPSCTVVLCAADIVYNNNNNKQDLYSAIRSYNTSTDSYTHPFNTHPFNGPLSGTTQVSRCSTDSYWLNNQQTHSDICLYCCICPISRNSLADM